MIEKIISIDALFDNETFLKLLDEGDSEKMVEFLRITTPGWMYRTVGEMFNDLEIFQDIATHNANPGKTYKYVLAGAFSTTTHGIIDLRGATVYYNGVSDAANSEIIIDNTTTIKEYGIGLFPTYKEQKYKLTFLGIPKIEEYGISIYPKIVNQIEIYAKANIIDDIKQLFNDHCIYTNRPTLRDKIKEI